MTNLSPGRIRILKMLDQQGPLHRHEIGFAFAKKRSMWTQAATRLAGYLCRPLLEDSLIYERRDKDGFHVHFGITRYGREAIRSSDNVRPTIDKA